MQRGTENRGRISPFFSQLINKKGNERSQNLPFKPSKPLSRPLEELLWALEIAPTERRSGQNEH